MLKKSVSNRIAAAFQDQKYSRHTFIIAAAWYLKNMSLFEVSALRLRRKTPPTHVSVKFKPEINRFYVKKSVVSSHTTKSVVSSHATKSSSKTKAKNESFEGFVAV
jgi:hypothetical protein